VIHALLIGSGIYLGGAALTAGLMAFGVWWSGERPGGLYDLKFLGRRGASRDRA
jgi:hypothetical protein